MYSGTLDARGRAAKARWGGEEHPRRRASKAGSRTPLRSSCPCSLPSRPVIRQSGAQVERGAGCWQQRRAMAQPQAKLKRDRAQHECLQQCSCFCRLRKLACPRGTDGSRASRVARAQVAVRGALKSSVGSQQSARLKQSPIRVDFYRGQSAPDRQGAPLWRSRRKLANTPARSERCLGSSLPIPGRCGRKAPMH